MEKLYDLMTMGFKYQLTSCASPEQFMHVTLNHLETIKRILRSCSTSSGGGGVALDLVQDTSEKVLSTYTVLSKGNWFQLRQSLMNFLQGKRIKVSLFLQQGMQGLDGVLALSNKGTMPFGTEAPGKIRHFDGRSCVKERKISLLPSEEGESDELKECADIIDTSSILGLNLFSKDNLPPPTEADIATIARGVQSLTATVYYNHLGSDASAAMGAMDSKTGGDNIRIGAKITQSSAKAELSMLSDLLGMGLGDAGSKSSGADEKPFKINLFPDNNFDSDSKSDRSGMITIDIDASIGTKTVSSYMNELGLKDDGSDGAKAGAKNEMDEEEDDLLAMMDDATSK